MVALEPETFRSIRVGDLTTGIKMKKLTGTTGGTEGDTTNIAHGLTLSKIIGCQVIVQGATNFIHTGFTDSAGLEYYYLINATNVIIELHTTNSENLLSKTITVLITYEE